MYVEHAVFFSLLVCQCAGLLKNVNFGLGKILIDGMKVI